MGFTTADCRLDRSAWSIEGQTPRCFGNGANTSLIYSCISLLSPTRPHPALPHPTPSHSSSSRSTKNWKIDRRAGDGWGWLGMAGDGWGSLGVAGGRWSWSETLGTAGDGWGRLKNRRAGRSHTRARIIIKFRCTESKWMIFRLNAGDDQRPSHCTFCVTLKQFSLKQFHKKIE